MFVVFKYNYEVNSFYALICVVRYLIAQFNCLAILIAAEGSFLQRFIKDTSVMTPDQV
jgi:hypothetical protein